jgi:hypothetical protein
MKAVLTSEPLCRQHTPAHADSLVSEPFGRGVSIRLRMPIAYGGGLTSEPLGRGVSIRLRMPIAYGGGSDVRALRPRCLTYTALIVPS